MPSNTTTNVPFTSTRRFGVEIEFCTRLDRQEIAEKLTAAGVNVRAEHYNHTARPHWKIVSDGSVSLGWELVSPILSGIEGVNEVKTVVAALVEAGATVDKSCGLHVHVDANDLTAHSIVNVVKRYSAHETMIDKVVPSHRRNNTYAGTTTQVARTVETYLNQYPRSTPAAVCERVNGRYYKLNLAAYLQHGTVEFRQHSGSIDGTKIANWIQFCVVFVQDSIVTVRHTVPTPPPAPVQVPVQVQTTQSPVTMAVVRAQRVNAIEIKYIRLLELFLAYGSYGTIASTTIAAALEISESSVPSYVSMFRDRFPTVVVKVRRNRGYYTTSSGSEMRYALNPNAPVVTPVVPVVVAPRPVPVAPPVPVTVVDIPTDRGIFANLPVAVRAFYQERAVDFE